jgi:uracil-DNA glycosylase family 4
MPTTSLTQIADRISRCTRCPELREYCGEVARTKRKAYADFDYWGRPVPSFGDREGRARIMIVGLAPGAHGANRTGRMFTGDRSGNFLYAALHRAGLANQPTSVTRDDGLQLKGVYITAAAHCAPPQNHPTTSQLDRCNPYLIEEMQAILPGVVLCLGGIAWDAAWKAMTHVREHVPKPRAKFAHAREVAVGTTILLGCYHVSQQNTFTGRLTPKMLDDVLDRARKLADRRH